MTEFEFFLKLPVEVRCMIWKEAAPLPRLVPIYYFYISSRCRSRIAPPTILHINQESRIEALKIYHRVRLGSRTSYDCYVDPTRDTVYLSLVHRANAHFGRYLHLQMDLVKSPDFDALFKNCTLGAKTFENLFKANYIMTKSGEYPGLKFDNMTAVCEEGDGPLANALELLPLPSAEDGRFRDPEWKLIKYTMTFARPTYKFWHDGDEDVPDGEEDLFYQQNPSREQLVETIYREPDRNMYIEVQEWVADRRYLKRGGRNYVKNR